jgi:hypothetical protein
VPKGSGTLQYNGSEIAKKSLSVQKSGDTMTGALIADVDVGPNDSRIYKNVASYYTTSNVTGTIKIKLPKDWSDTKMRITIKGYDYSSNGAWELIVAGYPYPPVWHQCSAELRGGAPFSQVRLGHDGTYLCILLGTTTTAWRRPYIVVEEMLASHYGLTGWETGWGISVITDETGITNIATPALRKMWHSGNDGAGSGLDADTVRGYVPVSKSGDTMTGPLVIAPAGTAAIEIGRVDGVESTPYIDFHSGAIATDYDARIQASGGNGLMAVVR